MTSSQFGLHVKHYSMEFFLPEEQNFPSFSMTPRAFQERSEIRWRQKLDQKWWGNDVSERKGLCVRWRKKTHIVSLVVVVWMSKCSSLFVTDSSWVSLIQIYLILSDHTRCSFIHLMDINDGQFDSILCDLKALY